MILSQTPHLFCTNSKIFSGLRNRDQELLLDRDCLLPSPCSRCEIFVFGNDEQILLAARLDNLGKGASGAAVQCLNIMMGIEETTGLI